MPFVEMNPMVGRPLYFEGVYEGGELHLHVETASRNLYVFGRGPQGGDKGELYAQPRDAAKVREWVERTLAGETLSLALHGSRPYLRAERREPVEGASVHVIRMYSGSARGWRWKLTDDQWGEFLEAITKWLQSVEVDVYVVLSNAPGPGARTLLAEAITANELQLGDREDELLAAVDGASEFVEVEDSTGAGVRVPARRQNGRYLIGPFRVKGTEG